MPKSQEKIEGMRDALSHRQGDRVPVGEFFWTGYLERYRQKLGRDFDPYRHFDLDYIVITPNMDPKVRPFEVIGQSDHSITSNVAPESYELAIQTLRELGNYPLRL